MAEGGQLPWKYQTAVVVPTLSYKNLNKPLRAPAGTRWHFDHAGTKEWMLVPNGPRPIEIRGVNAAATAEGDAVVVDGMIVSDDVGDDHNNTTNTAPFIEHLVQETDTFEGICLRYKITPTQLRRANNGFSGTNLHLAPNPLKIPTVISVDGTNNDNKKNPDTNTNSTIATTNGGTVGDEGTALPVALTEGQVVSLLQQQFTDLTSKEAKAYLELADWELDDAIQAATEDNFTKKM